MAMLTGCSQVKVTEYQQYTPVLTLEQFFDGPLTAHGVVKNRSGKVIRYFNADIQASWENGIGTLDESFVFNDGERQKRVWTLTPNGDNRYTAVAGDVTGQGDLQVSGNSLFMKYVLQVPYKGDEIEVTVDDRMYLVNDTTLINESTMFKFGFRVGEVLLVITKS
ncbi:MAG TPA: DUF3833 domain-containing protein [Marinagarivorans sp.]